MDKTKCIEPACSVAVFFILLMGWYICSLPETHAASASFRSTPDKKHYTIQFGAFSNKSRAEKQAAALRTKDITLHIVTAAAQNGDTIYKIHSGNFRSRDEANKMAETLCKNISHIVVKSDHRNQKQDLKIDSADTNGKAVKSVYAKPDSRQLINPLKGMLGISYLEIEPSFSYKLYYEDNISANDRDEIEDFSNRYQPELDISFSTPRLSFEGHTEVEVIEYFDEKDWNTVDQNHTLNAIFTANRKLACSIGGGYTVESDSDRYFETGGAPGLEGGYTVQRYKNKTKFFTATCQYDYSQKLDIQWLFAMSNFETAVTDDTDFYYSTLTINYLLNKKTTLHLDGAYQFFDFTFGGAAEYDDEYLEDIVAGDSFELFQDSDFEMTTYNLSMGLTYNFNNDCKLTLTGGWRYTENDRSTTSIDPQTGQSITTNTKKSGDGVTFSLDFIKRFSATKIQITASQNVGKNPDTGSTYEHRRFQLSLSHEITKRLTCRLRGSMHNQETDPDDEFGFDIDRDFFYFSAALSYKWKRWLSADLSYSYSNNDNKIWGWEVERNTFFLGLRFIPLRPYVFR